MSRPFVMRLDEVGSGDLGLVGGKGANLGELLRAGVRVPPGFVVTTDAYAHAVAALPESVALPAGEAVSVEPAELGRLLRATPVAIAVADAIAAGYRALGAGSVAVRSSATAEDLPGAAFAGQQDTFLNVSGSTEVVDAVRRCWASLWTDRAVAYRSRLGFDDRALQLAVVVQRMVDAEFAGVMFTAHPVTGDRGQLVIDAAPGLGEAVVSGSVTPEHVILDRAGRVLDRRPGRRGGQDLTIAALDSAVLQRLAQTGRAIVEQFGRPQDIEWAFAAGTLWIVQSRPMTALPPAPLGLNRFQRTYGSVLAELLPVRPFPLDMTTWTTRGHGRILVRMLAEIPAVTVDLQRMLPEVNGVVQQLIPPVVRPTWRTLITPLRMRSRIRRFRPDGWTSDTRFAAYDQAITDLNAVDLETVAWAELLALPDQAFAALEGLIDLRIDYLPRVGVDLVRLRAWLTVLGLSGAFGDLIAAGQTRTADANRRLDDLADLIRHNSVWRQAFLDQPLAALTRRVGQDESFSGLRTALHDYTEEFGHRETTSAFLMSAPTWGEEPELLLSTVQGRIQRPVTPPGSPAEKTERRVLATRRVRWSRTGPRLTAAIQAARSGIAFREDTHFHAVRALPLVRRSLLEAGDRLARAGVLENRDDILHLRLTEVTAISDPDAVDAAQREALRTTVEHRQRARAELAGAPLISPATLYRPASSTTSLVAGTPVSGGRATGAVRLILGPEDFGRLQPGEILVCPYTNPSWTLLFQVAAGVVVDTGGAGSHAAIVAREYGIPAVMGTGNATKVLEDGRQVTVDGTAGHVRAADNSSESEDPRRRPEDDRGDTLFVAEEDDGRRQERIQSERTTSSESEDPRRRPEDDRGDTLFVAEEDDGRRQERIRSERTASSESEDPRRRPEDDRGDTLFVAEEDDDRRQERIQSERTTSSESEDPRRRPEDDRGDTLFVAEEDDGRRQERIRSERKRS